METTTTRVTARRHETRRKLVEAALSEFGRAGIDATSVEQLCEAAGFTRGAFYSNFETKDDVCVAVARYMADECTQACQDVLDSATASVDIGELLTTLFGAAAFGPDRHRTMTELQLRANREPALAERLRSAREEQWPLLTEVVRRGAEQARCHFAVDVADLLRLCEALYFSPLLSPDGSNLRLMTAVVESLAIRDDQGEG